jgi:hypothetical protein
MLPPKKGSGGPLPRKQRASELSARDSVLLRTTITYSYLDISIFRFIKQNLSPIFSISRVTPTGIHCRRLPTTLTEYYGLPIISVSVSISVTMSIII